MSVLPPMLSAINLGKGEKRHCLIEIFKEHNKKMEALIDKEYGNSR
ncbi:hypothetical protein [Mucilaginibacter sp. PPCGB 2223]|nr:hypothetical protein [Mucilaginibacter sp. PPCGB 2223]